MPATLTPEQRKTVKQLASAEKGLFFFEQNGTQEMLDALEALGLIQYRDTTRYYYFSNGEPGEDDGFVATITDRGLKSAALAKAAGF